MCYIMLLDGDYREKKRIELPSYATSLGEIVIQSYSKNNEAVKLDSIVLTTASTYTLRGVSVYASARGSFNQALHTSSSGVLQLYDVICDITDAPTDNGSRHGISATSGGSIVIPGTNSNAYPVGIKIRASDANSPASIVHSRINGNITAYADMVIEGTFKVKQGTFFCGTSA